MSNFDLSGLSDIANGKGNAASTGATIGSFIPIIGSGLGGLIGSGLDFASGIYDDLTEGGNTGNDYPYMEVWRYFEGADMFGKPYQDLTTNKNYYNTDFKKNYENAANLLGISIPELINEFKAVINNNPTFLKGFVNNPSSHDQIWKAIHKQYLTLSKPNTGGSVSIGGSTMIQIGGNNNNSNTDKQIVPTSVTDNNTQKSSMPMIFIGIVALFLIFK